MPTCVEYFARAQAMRRLCDVNIRRAVNIIMSTAEFDWRVKHYRDVNQIRGEEYLEAYKHDLREVRDMLSNGQRCLSMALTEAVQFDFFEVRPCLGSNKCTPCQVSHFQHCLH